MLRFLRHDDIVDVLRRILCRVGCRRAQSPGSSHSTPKAPQAPRPPAGGCDDLLFSLENELCICDASIIHPWASPFLAVAAQVDGGAARRCPS
jgi:hypothetical protein